MILQAREKDENRTKEIFANPDCQALFDMFPDYYETRGFDPPWIAYFVIRDNKAVGSCGFTGIPKDGKVELAYWTFKGFEGQGVASFACKQLVSLSLKADPTIVITAKTLPEKNASTKILERNGFEFSGIVQDDDEGDVWGWTYRTS
jgi:RimJ/RimL family protein N-acetyltransferase